jgi:membrane protein
LQAADENSLPFLASALTFDALMAAIPFVLLLVVGLTHLTQLQARPEAVEFHQLFERFLPYHEYRTAGDPFVAIESLVAEIAKNREQVSLFALPTFLWFATRLFASLRTALNDVFDVAVRPPVHRGIIATYVRGKLRDIGMVIGTLLLFLANTATSTALQVLETRGEAAVPALRFFVTFVGRLLGEALAFGFGIALFYVIYKYASIRRLPWRAAVVASAFTAVAFEIAKRLYGVYLANIASTSRMGADANIGALILFVLWVYYTALVFLFGGVVAETWDLRERQRRQRAVLS